MLSLVKLLDWTEHTKLLGWIGTPTNTPPDHDTASPAAGAGVEGVEGNSRLTSATGVLLLALLAVEGVTILSVRQMITLHIYVGVLLLGPVLLKSGSTLYRFVRYYRGAPAYVKKGPPHPVLRIIGPFVILSSLALLGTGVALIYVGAGNSRWLLTAHQASFAVWVALMTVHVLGHVWEAAITSRAELRGALRGRAARGRRLRIGVIALALVLGVGAATVLLPHATSWTTRQADHRDGRAGQRP